jgi:hypothetical protein
VNRPIFDEQLHRLRLVRARRRGGDWFLHDRALDECLDRLADIPKSIASALVVGSVDPQRLATIAPDIRSIDDLTDTSAIVPASFDLCITIGVLETTNDLAAAAFALRHALKSGGLLIGTIVGGDSLPRLRAAMLAADRDSGGAAARLHPRIDGPSLAALLTSAGLERAVVDVDRVKVVYPRLDQLVDDLRTMGCTNVLVDRSLRPLTRRQLAVARRAFLNDEQQAVERFELLHFAAWAPQL